MGDSTLPFLQGGGEMGARIRAMDWSKTTRSKEWFKIWPFLLYLSYLIQSVKSMEYEMICIGRILFIDPNVDLIVR